MATATLLHVRELNARYLVPDGDPAVVAWLDRLMARVRHEALERALAESGIDPGGTGHCCILGLDRRVELDPALDDATNAARWSLELAGAVVEARRRGFAVLYRSDAHVASDMVRSCLRGDTSRRWAWTQTGLVERSWPTDPLALLVAGATHRPQPTLAALAGVCRAEPAELSRLRWPAMVQLAHALLGDRLVELRARRPGRDDPLRRRTVATVAADRGSRVLGHRVLDIAAGDDHRGTGARPTHRVVDRELAEVAALAVALADPSLLTAPLDVVDALDLMAAACGAPRPPIRASLADIGETTEQAGADAARRDAEVDRPREAGDDDAPASRSRVGGDEPEAADHHEPQPADRSASSDAPEPPDGPDVDAPVEAHTELGGLPMCWHLVDDVGLPDQLFDPRHPLAARPLRWTLHRVAMAIARTEAGVDPADDDPGCLAFAACPPGEEPPPGSPPDAGEVDAIDRIVSLLGVALIARAGPDGPTLGELCRRPALVVADPGWIEIHLSLDDVDLRLRRCGLDLDPGFVPWAGVVVRFRYG